MSEKATKANCRLLFSEAVHQPAWCKPTMINWIKSIYLTFFLLLATASSLPADFSYAALAELPPGERYRQLSLLLLVSGGIEPELLALMQPLVDREAESGNGENFTLQLDDYGTPLARIVDQDTMLASAAQLFSFTQENRLEIQAQLTDIASSHPILVSMVDVNQIAEDAIIIRNAIADSIEYSDRIDDPATREHLKNFRSQTIYLRNMMEFNIFQEDLAKITNEAIVDLGGRLDAYQRMFRDEIDSELMQRRIQSAEMMNAQTGNRYDEQAVMRTNEVLMMLILMESQVR